MWRRQGNCYQISAAISTLLDGFLALVAASPSKFMMSPSPNPNNSSSCLLQVPHKPPNKDCFFHFLHQMDGSSFFFCFELDFFFSFPIWVPFFVVGVQKERMAPEDMYILSSNGSILSAPSPKPYPNKPPKCTDCASLFMKVSFFLFSFLNYYWIVSVVVQVYAIYVVLLSILFPLL